MRYRNNWAKYSIVFLSFLPLRHSVERRHFHFWIVINFVQIIRGVDCLIFIQNFHFIPFAAIVIFRSGVVHICYELSRLWLSRLWNRLKVKHSAVVYFIHMFARLVMSTTRAIYLMNISAINAHLRFAHGLGDALRWIGRPGAHQHSWSSHNWAP